MEIIKKSDAGKKQENDKKEFLISEFHRFYEEKGFVPAASNMTPKNGYPAAGAYKYYFETWNKALEAAGLEINRIRRKLDGTETCSHCGKRADEISNHIGWLYHDGVIYCMKHGYSSPGRLPDYVKGILDINSGVGRGRAGEITVIKALKIGDEYDCNRLSCGHSFDMYNEEFGKIDVKTSVLNDKNNVWIFSFNAKKIADTYICIGMSLDTKHIEHVWVVPNEGKIRDLIGFGVTNTNGSLSNRRQWEVNSKIYDDAWQEMLENYINNGCKIFGKKSDI